MPDPFFSSKNRKRPRPGHSAEGESSRPKKLRRHEKEQKPNNNVKSQGSMKRRKPADEELESDQTDDNVDIDDLELRADSDSELEDVEDPNETPAEKRLRLAKLHLQSLSNGLTLADGEFDAAEIDRELISARLRQDVMYQSGKAHLFIADKLTIAEPSHPTLRTRGHRFSVTSAVASETGSYLFTSGKEGAIVKWDLASGKRVISFPKLRPPAKDVRKGKQTSEVKGHSDEVLALAISDDGRYLASGGRDRTLVVWNVEKNEWIKGFSGPMSHRDSISSLCFRRGSHQLFSGSFDRAVKVYDLSPSVMGYVETLFGHQDCVYALASLRGETCVSAGARDKTLRFWKIPDETQLVFRGGASSKIRDVLEGGQSDAVADPQASATKFVEGSMECVAMIDETTFVSGGDSGTISLWTTQKKKPVFSFPLAHGMIVTTSEAGTDIQKPRWITSIASLPYSDLTVSGSWDGHIRIWKIDSKLKSFSPIGTIHTPGVVNSLQLVAPPKSFFRQASWITTNGNADNNNEPTVEDGNPHGVLVIAGIGQEHRFGRWIQVKDGVVNGALVSALLVQKSEP